MCKTPDMPLKLLTLNIENSRHLARVRATIVEHSPDIVCLQEAIEADCAYLASSGGYTVQYALSGHTSNEPGPERNWGVAVLSRVPVLRQKLSYYADDPRMRLLREPNDPRRVLIVTELEHLGQPYRIITTHFTWSANATIDDDQRADFVRMKALLSEYSDYVLCGDFNAPRGREMFGKFENELKLIDHLPANIHSTLDPQFHRAGDLRLVVDTIFSTSQYRTSNVRVLDGISDHKGILALVERHG